MIIFEIINGGTGEIEWQNARGSILKLLDVPRLTLFGSVEIGASSEIERIDWFLFMG
jgi:hypothetical protein